MTSFISDNKLLLVMLLASVMVVGCRGSDETDIGNPRFPLTDDPDVFGAFLNPRPGVPREGVTAGDLDNVLDFPEAYYNTIDPDNTRDTLRKWREANGFINADGSEADCDPASCRQAHVRFRDTKDLGYGRNMYMRWNTLTENVAVYVENFQVDVVPGVPYGPLNSEALVNNDRQWNFGVNAIEFSAFPAIDSNALKFAKFYNFAGDGVRASGVSGSGQHFVDLDNRGPKPMPTACIVCHGGRGETLVIEDGNGELKLAPSLINGIAGDVQAHLQTIEFDTLQFASAEGFTREDNEDGVRLINEAILWTYEYRAERFIGNGDWDPTMAIETLKGRYAGDPGSAANLYDASYIPPAWSSNQNLYRTLAAPNCLVCHALRGTRINPSIGFPGLDDFTDYARWIDHLVFEQGKMPLGLLNYADFWDRNDKDPATMVTALGLSNRTAADQKAVRPGAAVAVISAPIVATGIDATGTALDIAITGAGSAFAKADSHQWQVSPSESASIESNGPSGDAVLVVSEPGTYTLTLTVDGVNGGQSSASQEMQVARSSDPGALAAGADILFFGPGGIEEMLSAECASCHSPELALTSMPVYYVACQSDDFNGNEFLYRSVLARVNFDSPLDSLFLRKGSNGSTDPANRQNTQIADYHNGGYALNDDADYSLVLSWILNGAPAGNIPAASTIAPICSH